MKRPLIEAIVNFNLTDHQKIVLIRTINAVTPESALSDTSTDEKLVTAREVLVNAGLLSMTDSTLELTDDGKEIMYNQGLIDDSDQLTNAAIELVPDANSSIPDTNSSTEDMPSFEGFDLIKDINSKI